MQCILYKIYFWKGFSYVLQIDMHLICTPMLAKFYSCKKWVLHYTVLRLNTTHRKHKLVHGEPNNYKCNKSSPHPQPML
jgi:hypothetical protein